MKSKKRNISIKEIEKDWKAIKNCSCEYITPEKMLAAIKQNAKSIKYFPASKITERILLQAVKKDYSIFDIIPDSKETVDRAYNVKLKLLSKPSFIRYLVNEEKFEIIKKYYAKDEGFIIVLDSDNDYRSYKANLKNFNDFAEALNNKFDYCNLLEFDFKDVDFKKYNFNKSYINAKVLKKNKVFDDSYFNRIVELTKTPDTVEDNSLIVYKNEQYIHDWKKERISYISDLHLGHRIVNHFKRPVSRNEVYLYVRQLAKEISNEVYDCLIIDGDLGIDYETNKVFFNELSKYTYLVVYIIGNHEIFGLSKNAFNIVDLMEEFEGSDNKYSIENRMVKYEKLCKKSNINMLQNKAIIFRKYRGYDLLDLSFTDILTQQQIIDIRKKYYDMEFAIFGTCGFSYLNKNFNYSNSLWGIKARDEKQEYIKANCAYNNLKLLFEDKKVVVVSHTPITDWLSQSINSNWIYVNGHTHRNTVIIDDEKEVYADNQIGYFNNSVGLKSFDFNKPAIDIFFDYDDGLYKITRNQYLKFCQYQGIPTTFNRKCNKIIMIKASGYYCFLVRTSISKTSKEKLYLLDGGKLKSTEDIAKNDEETIETIKNNIFEYAKAINEITMRYGGYQKQVANFIKSIGGYGKIHGCIIDIDYPQGLFGVSYNHVYVNPTEGRLTYYFAQDITGREIYKDLPTLLKFNIPRMLPLYKKYIKDNPNLPMVLKENNIETSDFEYDEGTYIYKQSRIIKKLQYITENKIIRIWDNGIIEEFKQSTYLPDVSNIIDSKK